MVNDQMLKDRVLVVGAGQAATELAHVLRQQKYPGPITLIGDEAHLPYRRPPLSKAYLAGELEPDALAIRGPAVYERMDVELRSSLRVVGIDRAARHIVLDDGLQLPYDKLVLATGGRPRRLDLANAEQPNLHYLRTIGDCDAIREQFQPGRRLLIVGGGYVGLEVAAVGIRMGLSVTVLEALPRVLARVAAPEISAFYEQAHRRRGVDLRTGIGLQALVGQGRVEYALLSDGSRIDVDLIIVGIGLIANTELATGAGLPVDNGIVVDAFAQTTDPDVLAIGDCANHWNAHLGRSIRLESVPSAMEQARTAALTLCGGPQTHAAVPWFWSDQYDLKLQMVGISQGYDQVVLRGDPNTESFAAFYLRDGVVISADTVNRPQEFAIAKRFVTERLRLAPSHLADDGLPLKSLLPTVA